MSPVMLQGWHVICNVQVLCSQVYIPCIKDGGEAGKICHTDSQMQYPPSPHIYSHKYLVLTDGLTYNATKNTTRHELLPLPYISQAGNTKKPSG